MASMDRRNEQTPTISSYTPAPPPPQQLEKGASKETTASSGVSPSVSTSSLTSSASHPTLQRGSMLTVTQVASLKDLANAAYKNATTSGFLSGSPRLLASKRYSSSSSLSSRFNAVSAVSKPELERRQSLGSSVLGAVASATPPCSLLGSTTPDLSGSGTFLPEDIKKRYAHLSELPPPTPPLGNLASQVETPCAMPSLRLPAKTGLALVSDPLLADAVADLMTSRPRTPTPPDGSSVKLNLPRSPLPATRAPPTPVSRGRGKPISSHTRRHTAPLMVPPARRDALDAKRGASQYETWAGLETQSKIDLRDSTFQTLVERASRRVAARHPRQSDPAPVPGISQQGYRLPPIRLSGGRFDGLQPNVLVR